MSSLDRACDAMVADGSIAAKNLGFVNAISALSNLAAIQSGAVTGFEQATPMDDRVLFFPELVPAPIVQSQQNPGHKGVRFLHFPSWHQPFWLGFVLLEQNTLRNSLTRRQQRALERAGRDALRESFTTSARCACGPRSAAFRRGHARHGVVPSMLAAIVQAWRLQPAWARTLPGAKDV